MVPTRLENSADAPFLNNTLILGGSTETDSKISINGGTALPVYGIGMNESFDQFNEPIEPNILSDRFSSPGYEFKLKFSSKCSIIKIFKHFFESSHIDFDNSDFIFPDKLLWIGTCAFMSVVPNNLSPTAKISLNKIRVVEENAFRSWSPYFFETFDFGHPEINSVTGNHYGSNIIQPRPQYDGPYRGSTSTEHKTVDFKVVFNLSGNTTDYTFDGRIFDSSSFLTYETNSNFNKGYYDFRIMLELPQNSSFNLEWFRNNSSFDNWHRQPNPYPDSTISFATYHQTFFTIPWNDTSISSWGLTSGGLYVDIEDENNVKIGAMGYPSSSSENENSADLNTTTTIGTSLIIHDTINYGGKLYIVKRIVQNGFANIANVGGGTRTLSFVHVGNANEPFNIEELGRASFRNTHFSGSLTIPNGMKIIGGYSFDQTFNDSTQMGSTSTLTLPESLVDIKVYAFRGTLFSGDLIIPHSITTIEDACFSECVNFSSVFIPSTVNTIRIHAFYNMHNVKTLYLNQWNSINTKSIIPSAFDLWDTTAPSGGGGSKNRIITNCTTTIIPASLNLSPASWQVIDTTTSFTVATDTLFGASVFSSNPNFKINILDEIALTCEIAKVDGSTTYTPAGTNPISIPQTVANDSKDYKIVRIAPHTFEGSTLASTSIRLLSNMQEIGANAFKDTNITGIDFSQSINLTSIDEYAFENCQYLTNPITFPNSLTTIGISAFKNCRALTGINLPENILSIGDGAFGECLNLAGKINFHNLSYLGQGAFYECSKLTHIDLTKTNLTEIYPNTFNGCSGLDQEITLPVSITSIDLNAFYSCTKIKGQLNLPKNLLHLGNRAFYNCPLLTGNIILPKHLKTIGEQVFYNCDGLNGKLQIFDEISRIEKDAFANLEFITTIIVNWEKADPANIYIGTNAFGGLMADNASIINQQSFNDSSNNSSTQKLYVHVPKDSSVTIADFKGLNSSVWEIKKDVDKSGDFIIEDDTDSNKISSDEKKITIAFILVGVLGALFIVSTTIAAIALKKQKINKIAATVETKTKKGSKN